MPGFDAYHKWMGIPPEDQPADHYRLLGLVRFESDRDVIDASVNKQMSYLRICAKGEHGDQAEEILNQVSQARLCLLDARQKRVYDSRLRGSASAAPQTLTANRSIETETAAGADRPSREHAASASDSVPRRNRATASFSRSGTPVRQPDRKSRPFRRDWSDRLQTRLRQPFVWIPAVCLLVAVVIVSLLSSPSDEDPSPGLADADGTVGDTTDRTDQTVIAAGSRHSTESSGGPPETALPAETPNGRDEPSAEPAKAVVPIVNSIGMRFVPIQAGTFTMGYGKTAHKVTLTKPFDLSVYEVTQQQYEKVMGSRPWQGKPNAQDGYDDHPASYVSHDDVVAFCRKLSQQEGVEYRLPTEAEWEYACRAGTTTSYSFGNDASRLGQYAWYRENAWDVDEKYAHRVGQKLPNPWGLYDMHGNVFEWCQDWYGIYPSGSVSDPQGQKSGSLRVLRGGSFLHRSSYVRSANRVARQPVSGFNSVGFRPARTYHFSP